MDQNHEVSQFFNNPDFLRQTMKMIRIPTTIQEITRNHDKTLINLKSLPSGYNVRQRIYRDFQEPMLNMAHDQFGDNPLITNSNSSSTANTSQYKMASIHGFIKYTFVLLNCVLIVFASITVAAGLLLYFDRFYGYSLIEIPYLSHLWSPADLLVSPSMLIIIGTCCFFFGSVGLYSGLADSKIGFGIYSVPLLFLAIIHICVGLALYGFPKQNPDVIKESLNKTFLKGVEDNSSPEFHLINDIQSCFQCCGAT
ncbi:hypothetical protein GJ496_008476, partial [Pomphorhynchus laevis]